MIGEQTAERIKIEIGSASPLAEEKTMEVRGRDMISGLPRKTVVTSEEIREALREPVNAIIEAVTRTLERAEPELAADLVDNGITLAGGGALLRGLDVVMQNSTGIDVRVADDATAHLAVDLSQIASRASSLAALRTLLVALAVIVAGVVWIVFIARLAGSTPRRRPSPRGPLLDPHRRQGPHRHRPGRRPLR